MKAGKEYELLIENLYRELEPNARITQDDYIYGRDTNTDRQIDVSIRYNFAGVEHLIIVQAKDQKKRADINIVAEFIGVIKDVNANRGILICSSGFTKKAIEYAKNVGIELLTIHSAVKKKWENLLKVKVEKVVHRFDLDYDFVFNVEHLIGKSVIFDSDLFSYDGVNLIQLVDFINDQILKKYTWKEIKKGCWITIDLKDIELFYIFNEEPLKLVNGFLRIKYISSKKQSFFRLPHNYLFQVNHINNTDTLHRLEISVEEIDYIVNNDFEHDMSVGENTHITVENFIFNDSLHFTRLEINFNGNIVGNGMYRKGNSILYNEKKYNRIAYLEKKLKLNKDFLD